ncbi:ABC transporter ATP-binding protein [Brachybacterium saurashtrense]|uniref:ABC transporter ATP-binding protein n=1 Tax=Brachybacterium saurashtrense TaxID=556288 RepID=A0A345YRT9_9MICO|nr:ABC transporter ATP-binding protein [Brachybacterium saurashtrense]AXK46641.1 ABC transporter ATP-binding protein [Brachybacterium saurashtrense]RRR22355.1 ABC transporter ATP-binding protein [Brachybacterium saurashtrense]
MTTATAPDTTTTAPALSARDVTVTYPDGRHPNGSERLNTVLHQASLEVARGEFAVILGPSGSGKSTLLSVAAGLVVPSSGTVRIDGTELTGLDEARRTAMRRDRISVVFQQPNLLPALTVRDQLLVRGHLAGLRGRRLRAERRRAEELLERVGMAQYADRRPHELSGGQRQRVNIARALVTEPSVLLVDEPTSALDHERSREVVDLLSGITRELRVATVMVTHDREFAEDADRVISLRDGRVEPSAA